MNNPLPAVLAPSPALGAQRTLLERIVAALAADERCLAAWLGGSLARDEGDAFSDVDVGVAIDDPCAPDFLANLDSLVDRMTATVFKRSARLGDTTVLTAITPDWQRFDISVELSSNIGRPLAYPRVVLFDRGGIQERFGPLTPAPSVPPERLRWLVEEFWRVLGLFVVVAGRGEYLVAVDGVMLLRRYLIDLMLLENGARRGGALHLNKFLTSDQRRVLEALPPLSPSRESVIASNLAYARAFRPLARRLAAQHGLSYPEEFEKATIAHVAPSFSLPFE
ncbi:MAG TPA: nucleotidyltransferase domain-containing protein [Chloroflexota bacterium]|nr:nucleotidyltransferase domain-containing protein [Chloroflexota bacterium]